ncbi:DUF5819 family protein [Streptomyces fuscichromogenes]|uniref:DUF5819 family protein n=1 Tax=Streptomyces fuscichromogenes TaxID=1324013 RepID=UPI0016708352|nr:DUF5819 family protein [Streptomyces fuscichromogenes]
MSLTVVVLSVVGVLVAAATHCAVLFLNITPPNSLSLQHAAAIEKYTQPEFTQSWKFFAPDPTTANIHVQARAKVMKSNGVSSVTEWVDLTAMDEEWIRHHPFPSQAQQNQLRSAWQNFVSSQDSEGHPVGLYGEMMQQYVLRIAAHSFGPYVIGGAVQSIQLRSASTPIAAPPWSNEHIDTESGYLTEPWWTVKAEDFQ